MAAQGTAKPATAETVNGLPNADQLVGLIRFSCRYASDRYASDENQARQGWPAADEAEAGS
jgi:hypothetical protein